MSRKKRWRQYSDKPPSQPRPPGRLPTPAVTGPALYIPDARVEAECVQVSTDRTRHVPCVMRGTVVNSPGTNVATPPDRSER